MVRRIIYVDIYPQSVPEKYPDNTVASPQVMNSQLPRGITPEGFVRPAKSLIDLESKTAMSQYNCRDRHICEKMNYLASPFSVRIYKKVKLRMSKMEVLIALRFPRD